MDVHCSLPQGCSAIPSNSQPSPEVTFYVPSRHGRFRAVVMPDMEEPFVPVSPESLGAAWRPHSRSVSG